MKTKEELNALKEELTKLNEKLHELTEEELKEVAGGFLMNSNDGKSIDDIKKDAKSFFTPIM